MKAKIYHNPRCSKSRASLTLLEQNGVSTEIIDYINNPLNINEIKQLIDLLGVSAADLVRTGEPAFRDSGLGPDAAPDQLIELMSREPSVMQRPIVVIGSEARIGRPPERVLELFA